MSNRVIPSMQAVYTYVYRGSMQVQYRKHAAEWVVEEPLKLAVVSGQLRIVKDRLFTEAYLKQDFFI